MNVTPTPVETVKAPEIEPDHLEAPPVEAEGPPMDVEAPQALEDPEPHQMDVEYPQAPHHDFEPLVPEIFEQDGGKNIIKYR